ncbi:MAG: hypothetical protein IPG76_20195 [Acidobacteria bacterium]|nr:hypothetical protein [Acidobacteriota bacterium]
MKACIRCHRVPAFYFRQTENSDLFAVIKGRSVASSFRWPPLTSAQRGGQQVWPSPPRISHGSCAISPHTIRSGPQIR